MLELFLLDVFFFVLFMLFFYKVKPLTKMQGLTMCVLFLCVCICTIMLMGMIFLEAIGVAYNG